jgi:hypothetical protein
MKYRDTTSERKAQILSEKVAAIIIHWPRGWAIQPIPEDKWQAEAWLRVRGATDETEITFHAMWREERISVHGTFPSSKADRSQSFGPPYGVDRPSATLAMDREPKKAAADIMRRVVKPYLELLRDAIKRRDEYDAAVLAQRATTAHLAKVLDVDLGNDKNRTRFGTGGKVDTVEVFHDGKVSLELRDLTPQVAEILIRQVQNVEQAAKTPLFARSPVNVRQC